MNHVYIAVGTNIDPEANIKAALRLLAEKVEAVAAVSSVYRTPPVGYEDQDDFLNMAVLVHTTRMPEDFRHDVLDAIEQALNRERDPNLKYGPRTIDLDIVLWNDEVFTYGAKPWRVPDADIIAFAHTAIPLAEIAPDYTHPETGQTLAEIAAGLPADDFEQTSIDVWKG